jgi:hypothetical protein
VGFLGRERSCGLWGSQKQQRRTNAKEAKKKKNTKKKKRRNNIPTGKRERGEESMRAPRKEKEGEGILIIKTAGGKLFHEPMYVYMYVCR